MGPQPHQASTMPGGLFAFLGHNKGPDTCANRFGAWPALSRRTNMSDRNATVVAGGNMRLSGFSGICCWPYCEREIGVINAPLCKPHLIKVYVTTQETYLWMMEPDEGSSARRDPRNVARHDAG
jgi:hypothetical protein